MGKGLGSCSHLAKMWKLNEVGSKSEVSWTSLGLVLSWPVPWSSCPLRNSPELLHWVLPSWSRSIIPRTWSQIFHPSGHPSPVSWLKGSNLWRPGGTEALIFMPGPHHHQVLWIFCPKCLIWFAHDPCLFQVVHQLLDKYTSFQSDVSMVSRSSPPLCWSTSISLGFCDSPGGQES